MGGPQLPRLLLNTLGPQLPRLLPSPPRLRLPLLHPASRPTLLPPLPQLRPSPVLRPTTSLLPLLLVVLSLSSPWLKRPTWNDQTFNSHLHVQPRRKRCIESGISCDIRYYESLAEDDPVQGNFDERTILRDMMNPALDGH